MTVQAFTLTRSGFQESVAEGDIFEHEGKQYVVTIIRSSKLFSSYKAVFKTKVIAQEYGSPIINSKFIQDAGWVKNRINLKKPNHEPFGLGSFGINKDGMLMQITRVNKVYYDFTDLVTECSFDLIPEWTQKEMDEAMQKNRRKKFKIIKNGKAISI